jgi:membrane dipeptidase
MTATRYNRGMRPLILALSAACAAGQVKVDPARVERVLRQAVVLDLHCDTTQLLVDENYDLAQRHNYAQVDVPRMREGGVTGIFLSIYTPARLEPREAMKQALIQIDAVRRETRRLAADLLPARTADEVAEAKRRGRIAVLMGVEGGHMIDSNLAILRTYFELGARYLTLTHSRNTPWADSSGDKPAHNGLTAFGREVVREMNRLGMMVDVSHVSDKTFYDVLETSSAPVIASHSSCRALSRHARNMTDDMLRALAKNGGVVHINYYSGFLDDDFYRRYEALKEETRREAQIDQELAGQPRRRLEEQRRLNALRLAKLGRPPLARLLDHFEHAAKIAGADHVGLGSDFDGVSDLLPEGMEDISKIPNLVRGLMERGFSDEEMVKILGGNTLRVMREVEKRAAFRWVR